MGRFDLVEPASELGIPFYKFTEEEWQEEMRGVEDLVRELRSLPTSAR